MMSTNTFELSMNALVGSIRLQIKILEANLKTTTEDDQLYMRGYWMGEKTALEGVLKTLEGEG